MKLFSFLVLLMIVFFSCTKSDADPNDNIPPVTDSTSLDTAALPHILILGTTGDSLVVWADDTLHLLNTGYQQQSYSMPGQMIAVDSNIYIAGGSENNKAIYYKNNVKTTLAQYYSYAASVSVVNNHVFVAGFSMDNNGNNTGETYTTYWQDGVRHTDYGINTQYHEVLASGSDVYLLGTSNSGSYDHGTMIYVKNGVYKNLSAYNAETRRMLIRGSDTYIAGNIFYNGTESHATVWKNGVETNLGSLTDFSSANAIFLKGDTTYVAGTINTNAVYWVNGVSTFLRNNARAWDIKVKGNDVYVVGEYYNYSTGKFAAVMWKNGEMRELSRPGQNASAFSLILR